jgi:hypothetical protein
MGMTRSRLKIIFLCGLYLSMAGCSTVSVSQHMAGTMPDICAGSDTPRRILVLWGAVWRNNQKEAASRKEIADRSITAFFNSRQCDSPATVLDSWQGRDAMMLTDAEAVEAAKSQPHPIGKIVFVRIEELGPFIKIYLSPILWEGGTNIVMRVRVLDAARQAVEADVTTNWTKGGAFVLRGVTSLDEDLAAALRRAFNSK